MCADDECALARYWVALQSLVLLLVFVLFEETGYDRVTHKPRSKISQAESWISNRLRTFFTCQSVDERPSLSNLVSIVSQSRDSL